MIFKKKKAISKAFKPFLSTLENYKKQNHVGSSLNFL
jgi:hypothetical protein